MRYSCHAEDACIAPSPFDLAQVGHLEAAAPCNIRVASPRQIHAAAELVAAGVPRLAELVHQLRPLARVAVLS